MPIPKTTKQHQAFAEYCDDSEKWAVTAGSCEIWPAEFTEAQAKRLAELENGKRPPTSWHAAKRILVKEGLMEA